MFNSLVQHGNTGKMQATLRFPFHCSQNGHHQENSGQLEPVRTRECECGDRYGSQYGGSRQTENRIIINPAVPFAGSYPKDSKSYTIEIRENTCL